MSDTNTEIMIERAGFESRRGLKTFDYCSQSYRFWCGECSNCGTELPTKDAVCSCGWTTIQFVECGL